MVVLIYVEANAYLISLTQAISLSFGRNDINTLVFMSNPRQFCVQPVFPPFWFFLGRVGYHIPVVQMLAVVGIVYA